MLESLPHGLYRVGVEQRAAREGRGGPSTSKAEVIAHVPSGPGRNFIRVLIGDRVRLELSSRDLTRGRIVEKL